MIEFEDIVGEARRFLLDKMSEQEKLDFELLLENHPHLREEVELMGKMISAMREIPAEEIQKRLKTRKDP